MGDVKQAHSEMVHGIPGLTSGNLARAIFKADVPEQFIRTLPAQSVFMAVKHNGLGSSTDLVELATTEQCKLMLDFDLWERDHFNEDNFWEWIALSDEDNGLTILQKILKSLDLKLVSLMIARYCDIKVFEDPTDMPPAPGYHTPDKGYTWIGFETEDADKHFLLARLLAMIFETSAETFYQLVAVPGVATEAMLEEEAYSERSKRLAAEGIPEASRAYEIHRPLETAAVVRDIEAKASHPVVQDIAIVEPLVYDAAMVQPLSSLLSALPAVEDLESELTLIMNAAITHWAVEYYDNEEVTRLISRVKGAVNIGLECAMKASGKNALEVYEAVGLQKLYRVGLGKLFALRKKAMAVPDDVVREIDPTSAEFSVLAGLRLRFPEVPEFVDVDGKIDRGAKELKAGFKAIDRLSLLEALERYLERDIAAAQSSAI